MNNSNKGAGDKGWDKNKEKDGTMKNGGSFDKSKETKGSSSGSDKGFSDKSSDKSKDSTKKHGDDHHSSDMNKKGKY